MVTLKQTQFSKCEHTFSLIFGDFYFRRICKASELSFHFAAGLDSIDTNKLDELEANLLDAEQSLIDANLDERYIGHQHINSTFKGQYMAEEWCSLLDTL